jgi:hypothetical protein
VIYGHQVYRSRGERRAVRVATGRAERQIASSATHRLYDIAKDATPIGETGKTRESWIQHGIEPHGSGFEGRVTNSDDVAAFLEWGVRAHDIDPKGDDEMSCVDPLTGRRISTKRTVHHPGIEAHHMPVRASVAVEAGVDEIALPHLEAWASEVEAAISAVTVTTK